MATRSKAAINKDRKYVNKSQKHETSTVSSRKTKAAKYKKKK
jgi:hypothetical protein